jgi:hypothetical protein
MIASFKIRAEVRSSIPLLHEQRTSALLDLANIIEGRKINPGPQLLCPSIIVQD